MACSRTRVSTLSLRALALSALVICAFIGCTLVGCETRTMTSTDLMADIQAQPVTSDSASSTEDPTANNTAGNATTANTSDPTAGNATANNAGDPTASSTTNATSEPFIMDDTSATALTNFGVELLKQTHNEADNVLVSPLSVEYALSMTANGARDNTLVQMESILGMPVDDLNAQLHAYQQFLSTREGATENDTQTQALKLANAIWFKDDLDVNRDFLQVNANYYGAGAFQAPFDTSTKDDINQWVSDHTDAMIPELVDEIPDEAIMYLVNALAFEERWLDPYEDSQVRDGTFTTQDGTEQTAGFMYSDEDSYLEGAGATGFTKAYEGARFKFVALLPDEGTTVDDLIAHLDGETLRTMLTESEYITVHTALPKFENEFDTNLVDALAAMGMPDAFDADLANFTGIATVEPGHNIIINRILHKTYISVDETGTKAAAATSVEMMNETSAMEPEDEKTVYLDRPFAYLIVDQYSELPVFMGVVRTMAS